MHTCACTCWYVSRRSQWRRADEPRRWTSSWCRLAVACLWTETARSSAGLHQHHRSLLRHTHINWYYDNSYPNHQLTWDGLTASQLFWVYKHVIQMIIKLYTHTICHYLYCGKMILISRLHIHYIAAASSSQPAINEKRKCWDNI